MKTTNLHFVLAVALFCSTPNVAAQGRVRPPAFSPGSYAFLAPDAGIPAPNTQTIWVVDSLTLQQRPLVRFTQSQVLPNYHIRETALTYDPARRELILGAVPNNLGPSGVIVGVKPSGAVRVVAQVSSWPAYLAPVGDGRIYFGVSAGMLYCLDADNSEDPLTDINNDFVTAPWGLLSLCYDPSTHALYTASPESAGPPSCPCPSGTTPSSVKIRKYQLSLTDATKVTGIDESTKCFCDEARYGAGQLSVGRQGFLLISLQTYGNCKPRIWEIDTSDLAWAPFTLTIPTPSDPLVTDVLGWATAYDRRFGAAAVLHTRGIIGGTVFERTESIKFYPMNPGSCPDADTLPSVPLAQLTWQSIPNSLVIIP